MLTALALIAVCIFGILAGGLLFVFGSIRAFAYDPESE